MCCGYDRPVAGSKATLEARAELLRRGTAAWGRGDWDEAIRSFHPDVQWHLSGFFPDFTGVVRGHEEVLRFWDGFTEVWERIEILIEEFREVGDKLLFAVRFQAEARDGMTVDMPQWHVCGFRDGLIAEYRAFGAFEEAAAAARADT